MTEQAEVELANRNGLLHPSQRGKLLDLTFWGAAVLAVAAPVIAVVVTVKSVDTRFGSALATGTVVAALGTAVPLLAIAAWFAVVCRRRLADAFGSRLVVCTGWTHDFGTERATDAYPLGLHRTPAGFNSVERFSLRAGGRTYPLERALRERIRPDRVNTALIAPRTKLLINVLPA